MVKLQFQNDKKHNEKSYIAAQDFGAGQYLTTDSGGYPGAGMAAGMPGMDGGGGMDRGAPGLGGRMYGGMGMSGGGGMGGLGGVYSPVAWDIRSLGANDDPAITSPEEIKNMVTKTPVKRGDVIRKSHLQAVEDKSAPPEDEAEAKTGEAP